MNKITPLFILTLLLANLLVITFDMKVVKASGTITIMPDGSIEPPTANIASVDNITYTFTGHIYDEIQVSRGNIIISGNGYTLQGSGYGDGFRVWGVDNVTIENTNIQDFFRGVWLWSSSNSTVSENNITANSWGTHLDSSSSNTICENNMIGNFLGIRLDPSSSNNNVSGNTVKWAHTSIWFNSSSGNTISRNSITNSSYGLWLRSSSNNNTISGNIIINNLIGIRIDARAPRKCRMS